MPSKMSKFFGAAHKLYQSCSQLCSLHAGDNEDMLILYMTIFNNMALVENELGLRDGLQGTMTTLRQVVGHVVSMNGISPSPYLETISQVQLNAITVSAQSPAPAA